MAKPCPLPDLSLLCHPLFPKAELVLLPLLKNLLEPCGLDCYTWLFVVKPLHLCLPPFMPAPQHAATLLPVQTSDCSPNMPGLFTLPCFLIENHGNFNSLPCVLANSYSFLKTQDLEIPYSGQLLPYNKVIIYFHDCFCLKL